MFGSRVIGRPSGTRGIAALFFWVIATTAGPSFADRSYPWGISTDVPVRGDFDGDGKSDIAVWRPSNGTWYIVQSSNGATVSKQWGAPNDVPVVGDFDGDGKSDIAVWRPSNGVWYIVQSSNGATVTKQWGAPNDVPVVGDFDGDGKSDIAVWRPSNGNWYIVQSGNGTTVTQQWGAPTDTPVVGDFDGDGKSDIAVWRPSNGNWYVIESSSGASFVKQWGASTDTPVVGDFDGDGQSDFAVWRPASGNWYIVQSSTGQVDVQQWGAANDMPVQDRYNGSAQDGIALWRPTNGTWYLLSRYTVGGTVNGLSTSQLSSLVLSDGTSTTSPVASTGLGLAGSDPFSFQGLQTGAAYSVSVVIQPPGETCSVTQGATGTVGTSNVTNVVVTCLAGSWTSLASMPYARGYMAVAVLNNLIYTIGGVSNNSPASTQTCFNNVTVYDASKNSWSFAAPVPLSGFGMGATAINGKIYVFGGTDCNNNNNSVSTVYAYDPSANSWTAVSNMAYGGNALTNVAVATDGTYAYVFGGINAANLHYSQAIQVYDPVGNRWASPTFTTPPMAGGAAVWQSSNGSGPFLVVPGYGPSGALSTGYQYFPGSNAGIQYSVPFATDFPAAAAVGSNVYVAVVNSSNMPQFYQLPQSQLAPPSVAQVGASAAVVDGVFYLIGGLQPSGTRPGTGAVEAYQLP